jgi:mannose-6-phosphate isomerase
MEKSQFDTSKFKIGEEVKKVDKPWGYEIHWAQTDDYTGKIIHINKGKRLSLQYHDKKEETEMLLSGRATIWMDNEEGEYTPIEMREGYSYHIAPLQRHRLEALEDSDVVEVSTPEKGTTFRLDDDFQRGDETEKIREQPGRGWKG